MKNFKINKNTKAFFISALHFKNYEEFNDNIKDIDFINNLNNDIKYLYIDAIFIDDCVMDNKEIKKSVINNLPHTLKLININKIYSCGIEKFSKESLKFGELNFYQRKEFIDNFFKLPFDCEMTFNKPYFKIKFDNDINIKNIQWIEHNFNVGYFNHKNNIEIIKNKDHKLITLKNKKESKIHMNNYIIWFY